MKAFEFDGKVNHYRIEGYYKAYVETNTIDADGIKIDCGHKLVEVSELTLYQNGKRVAHHDDPSGYKVAPWYKHKGDTPVQIIWGLRVALPTQEIIDAYNAWIAELIEEGTTDEAREYKRQQKIRDLKYAAERYQRIVTEAEKQKDIPSRQEAKARMKQYNDIFNEGGEGYVPYIYSMEEYTEATNWLKEHKEELENV